MLFNSLAYALFLPLVTLAYFVLPHRHRVWLLLAASCAFYMSFIPVYIFILFTTITIDYLAAIAITRASGPRRKQWLVVSIVATCAVLFVFKYDDFFAANVTAVAGLMGWHLPNLAAHLILPIGLSFHTFQSLSYVIEVYRGRQKAQHDFAVYATYVMFFPQLVAGPIERPQNLLTQFGVEHEFDAARVTSGLRRIGWGLFKKAVIADRLALYVNDVYAAPRAFNGLQLSAATVFFAYQIYCDFSGYSDIAIGSARILGFRLMENFRTPYIASSMGEFWQRWHISLSSWFRDYLYVPLGGNRKGPGRRVANVMTTFAVSGLWHGANWTYVVWGLMHGIYLLAGEAARGPWSVVRRVLGIGEHGALRSAIQIAATFALTLTGWVVFRARTLGDAGYVFTHWSRGWDIHAFKTEQFLLRQLPVALAAIAVLEIVQWMQRRGALSGTLSRMPQAGRWALYLSFCLAIILFGVFRRTRFIYFQF